jgi:hypothetical protein
LAKNYNIFNFIFLSLDFQALCFVSLMLSKNFYKIYGSATNVMLFFRSKGVATPLLRKNRKKKTLNLQH